MMDILAQMLWWSGFVVVPLTPIIVFVLLRKRVWYVRAIVAVFACGATFAFLPMMAWSILFRDGMKVGMIPTVGWEAWESAFPGMLYCAKWGSACLLGIAVTHAVPRGKAAQPANEPDSGLSKHA